MAKFNAQKHWWVVIVAAAVVGVAAILITEQWVPGYGDVGGLLFFGFIAAGFCWVYSINRERLWWAIIPGLGVFVFLVALLTDLFIGTDPENDWLNVLVIGIGAVIIAAVLKRRDAKRVLIIVAMFALLVGIAMAPLTPVLKGVLIAADVLAVGFFIWRKKLYSG